MLELQKSSKDHVESSHIPFTEFPLMLKPYRTMVPLTTLRN